MNKKELFEYCNNISKKQNVEFYYQENNLENVSFEKFSLGKTQIKENKSLLIKVIYYGQIGEYTISQINKKNIKIAIDKAKKIAKLKNNIKIKDFPSKNSKKKIKFDKSLNDLDFDNLIEECKSNLKKEKYFTSYEGGLYRGKSYNFYINPYFNNENEKSQIDTSININTKYKKASSAYYSNIFTKTKDINLESTFNQAKINAYKLLNPKQGKKGVYDLIFIPELTNELIEELVVPATIGETIYKNESYLSNLKNKKIFSKSFSLYEEPHIDYFTGSSNIDDEGNKTKAKSIIENGVFKKEIYDVQSAQLCNKKSTGNGFRSSAYSSINCEHTNLLQKPGSKKIDSIIKNTNKGILVFGVMGLHTSNLTNGEFTLTINQGKEINNGQLENTITNLNISGNAKTSFKNILFSKEQKFFGDSLYSFSILKNQKVI